MNKKIIIVGIGVYALSAIASYFIFSKILFANGSVASPLPPPKVNSNGTVEFDASLPKTQACPLNGVLYSKQQEKWWQGHRPLGVMIENSTEARPQSGLSSSDIVFESVAEGGITRFLSIFYCQDAGEVGPVRSARTYFVDFISGFGNYPLYAHVGGANTPGPADALGQISDYGWGNYNDLNQFAIGFPVFWRDYDRLGHTVATEHTMYSTTQKLWDYAAKNRDLTNVDKNGKSWDTTFDPYEFKDDAQMSSRPENQTISFDFWGDSSYAVKWVYQKANNTYVRFNGGEKHIDRDNNKQLTAKNIVILYMTERNAIDGYTNNEHQLFGDKGTGKAVIFMDGKKISGTWGKASRTASLRVKDFAGEEIKFDRGRIWFEILSTANDSLTVE